MQTLRRLRQAITRLPLMRYRRVRAVAGVALLALVGLAAGITVRSAVDTSHASASKNPTFILDENGPRSASSGGAGGSAPGSASRSGGGGGSNQGTGGPGHSGGGPSGSAKPRSSPGTPPALPTPHDAINATPNIRTSNCVGYPRNVQCKVYVSGAYGLVSHPAGKIVIEVLIDHKVVTTQSINAPRGGYRYGWTMQFTVPMGPHEIDYQAFLDDTSGDVLADSGSYVTYAA